MTLGPDNYHGGALLVADGELPPAPFIRDLARRHSLIVATDGAALRLHAIAILPDVIIGDMDTLGNATAVFKQEGSRVIRLESQEENDLEKALRWLAGEGTTKVTAIGITGGMPDHALNNFSVLAKMARSMRIGLRAPELAAYIIHERFALTATPGDRISLIPLPSALLTTTGLLWELQGEPLAFGMREGASNQASSERVEIAVAEGTVILFHYPQPRG